LLEVQLQRIAPMATVIEELDDLHSRGVGEWLLRDDPIVDLLHEVDREGPLAHQEGTGGEQGKAAATEVHWTERALYNPRSDDRCGNGQPLTLLRSMAIS